MTSDMPPQTSTTPSSPLARPEAFARASAVPVSESSDYLSFLTQCASAYERMDILGDRLLSLDRAAGRALRLLERRARDRHEHLDRLRSLATVAPDGRRAYLTKDGANAVYEGGTPMSRHEWTRTKWNRRSVCWEDYAHGEEVLAAVLAEHRDVVSYRERIGSERSRMIRDEPLDSTLLEQLERDLEQMPDTVRQQIAPTHSFQDVTSTADCHTDTADGPRARGDFNRAARGRRANASGAGRVHARPARTWRYRMDK